MADRETNHPRRSRSAYRGKRQQPSRGPAPLFFLLIVLVCVLVLVFALWLGGGESGPTPSPSTSPEAATHTPEVTPTPTLTPTPTPTPTPIPEEDAWKLHLINFENFIPEDFAVPEFTELSNGHKVDSRIYPDLQEMMDDARAAGHDPLICSSYRTWTKQETLFANQVQRYVDQGYDLEAAEALAPTWVARPGTSEHQIGLAVDIVSVSYQVLDEKQEETSTQQWLMEHCWEYGFILRYPSEKRELTGVNYEPWHYRYVGHEAAKEIMESGVCLEEYLEQLGR